MVLLCVGYDNGIVQILTHTGMATLKALMLLSATVSGDSKDVRTILDANPELV